MALQQAIFLIHLDPSESAQEYWGFSNQVAAVKVLQGVFVGSVSDYGYTLKHMGMGSKHYTFILGIFGCILKMGHSESGLIQAALSHSLSLAEISLATSETQPRPLNPRCPITWHSRRTVFTSRSIPRRNNTVRATSNDGLNRAPRRRLCQLTPRSDAR
jgi:hypothetical protein